MKATTVYLRLRLCHLCLGNCWLWYGLKHISRFPVVQPDHLFLALWDAVWDDGLIKNSFKP